MFRPINPSKRFTDQPFTYRSLSGWLGVALWIMPIGALAGFSWLTSLPSQAHQVEVSNEVGGTLHIEPNDSPRAGTASLTWFALNRRGGQPIRLADCNCSLSLYAQPRRASDTPIQRPPLRSANVEGRSGVPSATITFPWAGSYELVLKGQPNAAGAFAPFELRFSVTVAQ
jgi:hypothetical protein